MNENPLTRVRRLCAVLPETEEKIAWGAPTFRIRNKLIAMFADDHHGDGRIALWVNAPQGLQPLLIESEPEKFFRPPYVGPKGWIGVVLINIEDDELMGLLRQAFVMVAPKKLLAQLDGSQAI